MQLEELTGEVEYRLAGGGVGSAIIAGRIRQPCQEDRTWPRPYRSAWNGIIFLSVTQDEIDHGDWWPARGEAQVKWNEQTANA